MADKGKRAVSAVLDGGLQLLELEKRRRKIPDPLIGGDRDGVRPGEWGDQADVLGLPPECPVQPLGMDGDTLFVIDALGQLSAIEPNKFGQNFVQRLFGHRQGYLWWAWPRVGDKGKVTGFDMVKFRGDMYAAGAEKGLWKSVEKVRGLGAWTGRDGGLILHCGEFLWRGGKLEHPGELDGHFYPRRPKTMTPWTKPVQHGDNPAPAVLKALRTWNWRRPEVDPFLFLGWMGAALLGGALPWRPSMFLVGDKAVGKSTLQYVVKAILGDALISTPDTTPAGIYQRIGNDALPVAVDELEAEADNRKVMAVVKLARLAASGGLMLRGGADHNGVEFQARSCFLFSAINPPPLPPQDLSRLAVLNIDKLDLDGKEPKLDEIETIGPKFLRLLADGWPNYDALYQEYRAVLRAGGHDSRGQDTYGTFLTCAHLLLGDEGLEELGLSCESFDVWSDRLSASMLPEREDAHENWRACLEHLLTSRVEAWRSGARQTVGQLLEDLKTENGAISTDGTNNAISAVYARRELGQAGLGLVDKGKVAPGYVLAVPNKGPLISAMFRGTPWGGDGGIGVWGSALRQGPAHIISTDKTRNLVKINGVAQRCTLVVLDEFATLTEGKG